MALFSGEGCLFLLRWFHFLAGITWIGMLYYFNFVQTPFFGSKFVADNAAVRSGIVARRPPRQRAVVVPLGRDVHLHHRLALHPAHRRSPATAASREFAATSYGWKIFFGGMLGTVMWANVWFVIWPGQQVVMASAAAGGRAAGRPSPRPPPAARAPASPRAPTRCCPSRCSSSWAPPPTWPCPNPTSGGRSGAP